MEFEDDAFVLAARPFGETGALVEALTSSAAYVGAPSPDMLMHLVVSLPQRNTDALNAFLARPAVVRGLEIPRRN